MRYYVLEVITVDVDGFKFVRRGWAVFDDEEHEPTIDGKWQAHRRIVARGPSQEAMIAAARLMNGPIAQRVEHLV